MIKSKRKSLLCLLLCASILFGCKNGATEIQNSDDGILRIDEEHSINFYLENDTVGVDSITEQCLTIIGDQAPNSIQADLLGIGFQADDFLNTYYLNGAEIIILHYGTEPDRYTLLWEINLGSNHVLASGIRIGSTEDELKRCYGDNKDLFFEDPLIESTESRFYDLYGEWYERYLILFEVDAETGLITSISYEFDT